MDIGRIASSVHSKSESERSEKLELLRRRSELRSLWWSLFSLLWSSLTKHDILAIDRDLQQDLSERFGKGWKKIGRHLGLTDEKIDGFEGKDDEESAYQLLRKWIEQAGSSATHQHLATALRKAGRTDLAEYVEEQGNQKLQSILGLQSALELSELLGRNDALAVAGYCNLTKKDIQGIEKSDNPGATCIEKVISKRKITSFDSPDLTEAVEMLRTQKIKKYLQDFVNAEVNRNSPENDLSFITIRHLQLAQKLDTKRSLALGEQFGFLTSELDRIRESVNPGVTFIRLAVLDKGLFKVGELSRLEATIT